MSKLRERIKEFSNEVYGDCMEDHGWDPGARGACMTTASLSAYRLGRKEGYAAALRDVLAIIRRSEGDLDYAVFAITLHATERDIDLEGDTDGHDS